MPLDFTTLYVIILLNSTGFALVWAIIARSYRSLRAARYWFVSLAMTCASGPVLVMGESAPLWGLGGNLMVIVAFGLLWQGVRVFFGERPRWLVQTTIVVALAILAVLAGSSRPALNVIFAVGQLMFIGVTI